MFIKDESNYKDWQKEAKFNEEATAESAYVESMRLIKDGQKVTLKNWASDVINEMYTVYRNTYGESFRNYPICDEPGHEKWCFDTAKRFFPNTRLFWNEGCYETFGGAQYTGDKSRYYLMLKRWLAEGAPIEGIGMQFHAFGSSEEIYNPYRAMDVFRLYSEFKLPIHLSEVSIPSYSNEAEERRFYKENTGYYHVTGGPREQKFVIQT